MVETRSREVSPRIRASALNILKSKPCLNGKITAGVLNGIEKVHSVHTDKSVDYHFTPSVGTSVELMNGRLYETYYCSLDLKHSPMILSQRLSPQLCTIWNLSLWPLLVLFLLPAYHKASSFLCTHCCLATGPSDYGFTSETVTPSKPLITVSLLFQVLWDTNRRLRNTL